MADAGLRIAVEGEKEFKAALASVDTAVKNNNKSLRLLTEEYNLNSEGLTSLTTKQDALAKQEEILATKGKVLSDSIAQQTEKVDLLDLRVEEAAKAYGEHDKRTEALRGQLLDASVALAKMTAEQEKNNKAIEANKTAQLDAQHSTAEYEQAVEALSASVAANDAEIKRLTEAGKDLEKENGSLGRSSDDMKKRLENLQAANEKLTEKSDKLRDSVAKQREITENLSKAQKEVVARYGEGSKESEAYRKKVADATTQLDRMESELKQTEKAIENNNKAIENGGEAPTGMITGLKEVAELTGIKIPEGIQKMIGGESTGFLGAAAATTGIIGGLTTVLKKIEDVWQESLTWAQDVTTKAAELDLSTEEYQEFEYIAKALGADVGVFENALSKLQTKAGETAEKNAELREEIEKQKIAYQNAAKEMNEWYHLAEISDSFKDEYEEARKNFESIEKEINKLTKEIKDNNSYWDDLGVSIEDDNGYLKSSKELLLEVTDALGAQDNDLIKAAKGNELFGKAWNKLNPVIGEGSQRLRELAQEAHETGSIIEESIVAVENGAKNAQDVIGQQWTSTVKKAAAEFKTSSNMIEGAINGVNTMMSGALNILERITKGTWYGGIVSGISQFAKGEDALSQWWWKVTGQYADGTDFHPGGYALVGERGPEIVRLPRGSAVYPNGTAPAGMSSTANTYNITIDARNIREFNDIIRYAQGARVAMRRG